MEKPSKHRWIKAILMQVQSDVPGLPWERDAKRARRADNTRQSISITTH